MVDCGEFGSGGNGWTLDASDVVLADTTTAGVSLEKQLARALLTSISSSSEVNGNLAADASGSADDEGHVL